MVLKTYIVECDHSGCLNNFIAWGSNSCQDAQADAEKVGWFIADDSQELCPEHRP